MIKPFTGLHAINMRSSTFVNLLKASTTCLLAEGYRTFPNSSTLCSPVDTSQIQSSGAGMQPSRVTPNLSEGLASLTDAGESPKNCADSNGLAHRREVGLLSKLRWHPTSDREMLESEARLLTLLKSPHTLEKVNIGPAKDALHNSSWLPFGATKQVPDRFINTLVMGDSESPPLVMLHGYGASMGFYFRNLDALAKHFHIYAVDQLGWGTSSRPQFQCKTTEETEDWFVESLEEWRKAVQLDKFVLLGHSFGGYVASRYALKYPEHVQHLILVGPAGFAEESEAMAKFKSTWKGKVINSCWDANARPQQLIRGLGWWGPRLVLGYTSTRFGERAQGKPLKEGEAELFTDYMYHTLAGKASGELCLKHIFSLGAFARKPLIWSAKDWKVTTSFCYGVDDWMDYRAGKSAAMEMPVEAEVMRIRKAGHYAFLDNPSGFHEAVLHSCRNILKTSTEFMKMEEEVFMVPLSQNLPDSPLRDNNRSVHESQVGLTPGRKVASEWRIG